METWLLLTAYKKLPPPYLMVLLATLYNLPFRRNSLPRNWHTVVRYDPSRSFNINDFHVV